MRRRQLFAISAGLGLSLGIGAGLPGRVAGAVAGRLHAAETVALEDVVSVTGGRVAVAISGERLRARRELLLDWVAYSAAAVADYYRRLPVPQVQLALIETGGAQVDGGRAFGGAQPAINVRVGGGVDAAALRRDWVLVHELIHLALPQMSRRQHWLEEGLAVYVESVARVHAGHLSEDFVWRGFLKGMPHGLPKAGDQGLDNTPSWGRTYWGGALFCLLADIEIRRRTAQRKSLRDALIGLLDAGLDMRVKAPMSLVVRRADAATGVPVFAETWALMGEQPQPASLQPLWRSLGVSLRDGQLRYDDAAPQAAMRRALLAPPA